MKAKVRHRHRVHRLYMQKPKKVEHEPLPPALPLDGEYKADPQSPFVGGKAITENENKFAEDLHDWILGGQDGLVNVLGTLLGIAIVTTDKTIIIVGGLASLFAEAISIAAVAYTSVKASSSFYYSERETQRKLIEENPYLQREVLIDAFERKRIPRAEAKRLVEELTKDKNVWLELLMEEHLHIFPPDGARPLRSAFIVGTAATIGSFIALAPFFFLAGSQAIITALLISTVVLFAGGAASAKLTIGDWRIRGLEIATIGMVAALAGFAIGWIFTNGIITLG